MKFKMSSTHARDIYQVITIGDSFDNQAQVPISLDIYLGEPNGSKIKRTKQMN